MNVKTKPNRLLIFLLTLCMVFPTLPVSALEADDTRIGVSEVKATANIDSVFGYGKPTIDPTFTVTEGAPAKLLTDSVNGSWQKLNEADNRWVTAFGNVFPTFDAGTWRYKTQARIEGADAATHCMERNAVITVNDVPWTAAGYLIDSNLSSIPCYSPSMKITDSYPLAFQDSDSYDIPAGGLNIAIEAFDLFPAVSNGAPPYHFSMKNGPSWLTVSAGGKISGKRPDSEQAATTAEIQVKDANAAVKTITINVGAVAERTVISEIAATSNIASIFGYGKPTIDPTFTLTKGSPAVLETSSINGRWEKWDASANKWTTYDTTSTFDIGAWRYTVKAVTDSATHVMVDATTVTVDGVLWTAASNSNVTYTVRMYNSPQWEITEAVPPETPNITAQPEPAVYTIGDSAAPLSIAASVTDGGTLTYQWYKNTTTNTTNGTPCGTGTTCMPDTSAAGTLYYYCIVTNSKDGDSADLTSRIVKIVTNHPALTGNVVISGTAKYGETLTAAYTPGNNTGTLSYQWLRNSVTEIGSNSTSYQLTQYDIGSTISCKVSSTVETGSVESAATAVVAKADGPAAPEVTGGTLAISWTTSKMQYRKTGEEIWKFCTNGSTAVTDAGTYEVRLAETATRYAGQTSTITVADGTKKFYSVSYQGNGGEGTAPSSIPIGYMEGAGFNLPGNFYEYSNHRFIGWSDGKNTYSERELYIMPAASVTFTAQWEELYAVSFDANGGTGTAPTQDAVAAGETVTLPENPYTKTGYTFSGWNDGTATYDAGATYTMPAAAVTFTAQWKAEITEVTVLDLTKPALGATPDYTVSVPAGSNYTAEVIGWYNVTASGETVNPTDTFIANSYSVSILLKPNTGYCFAARENMNITLEGCGTINKMYIRPQGENINFSNKFDLFKPAATPTAEFSFDGPNANRLMNVTNFMQYSLDGGSTWINCTTGGVDLSSATITETNDIKVKDLGILPGLSVSAIQTIDITKAEKPSAAAVDCTSSSNDNGKLTGVTAKMEYRKSGADAWIAGTGSEITDLSDGTYEVRVKTAGTALASDPQTLTIRPYSAEPSTGDEESKVEIGELTDAAITEALKGAGFTTVDVIKEELLKIAVTYSGYTSENSAVYDAQLMISTDGGTTWVPATPDNFPADGKLPAVIPYPAGTNQNDYDFVVVHMFATNVNGKTPGETETPEVTKADDGLHVTLTGLSPISVSWKATTPENPAEYTVTFDANGGNCGTTTATTGTDGKLASLPTATRSGSYSFKGWYTETSGGTKIPTDYVFSADTTVYAQWTYTGGGSGGGGGTVVTTKYTLTFNTNGGSKIDSISKTSGTTVDLASYKPTKDGYTFDGWYSDKKLTEKVTSVKLTKDTTVYAKWETKNPDTGVVLPFIDVKNGDWFYDDVAYVFEKGLMYGTSSTTFSPNMTTTRGMIVTVLYRQAGSPTVSGNCPFNDVKSGMYYEAPIAWAAANGIVKGYSADKFGPDDPITREQMAAILYRYAQHKGIDVSAKADLSKYNDAAKVSDWAKDAIAWTVKEGIFNGVGDGLLSPETQATRAQIAAILHRFCENIAK